MRALVERQLQQQAYTMAVTDLFLLSSALFVALIALVWLSERPPRLAGPGAKADAGAH